MAEHVSLKEAVQEGNWRPFLVGFSRELEKRGENKVQRDQKPFPNQSGEHQLLMDTASHR